MALRVATGEVLRFMVNCLQAAGAAHEPAVQHGKAMLYADRSGVKSHGLARLDFYVNDIQSGVCKPNNRPTLIKESPSVAVVDANACLGGTASCFSMDLAIQKAKRNGVGWVTVKGSNHNVLAGYWAGVAANHGCIGLSFSNTSPIMAPTRSSKKALGTNPLAVAAPGSNDEQFCLDMATTAVSIGKVEYKRRLKEPIPHGWALGADGNSTTDPEEAIQVGTLFPLGGLEETGGYKGYGLAAVVDIFCGISSGSKYGHHIKGWLSTKSEDTSSEDPRDLGHCFVAVDINCLAPGFRERLGDCMQYWRQLEPVDPKRPVVAPGDNERMNILKSDETGVIEYMRLQVQNCAVLADKLNVQPMKLANDGQ